MAMTNKSLLKQYLGAVKAIEYFSNDPELKGEWWTEILLKDCIENEKKLKIEILKRKLEIPSE
jgi:hypothetical protein